MLFAGLMKRDQNLSKASFKLVHDQILIKSQKFGFYQNSFCCQKELKVAKRVKAFQIWQQGQTQSTTFV